MAARRPHFFIGFAPVPDLLVGKWPVSLECRPVCRWRHLGSRITGIRPAGILCRYSAGGSRQRNKDYFFHEALDVELRARKRAIARRAVLNGGAPRPIQASESERRTVELLRQGAGERMRYGGECHAGGLFSVYGLEGRRDDGRGAARDARRAMRRAGRLFVIRRGLVRRLMIAGRVMAARRAVIHGRGALLVMLAHRHAKPRRQRGHSLRGNGERQHETDQQAGEGS